MNVDQRLMRTGLRRGLLGGSRPWLLVGVGAGLLRLARRAVGRRPEVVFRGELNPGETLVIAHQPATTAEAD